MSLIHLKVLSIGMDRKHDDNDCLIDAVGSEKHVILQLTPAFEFFLKLI